MGFRRQKREPEKKSVMRILLKTFPVVVSLAKEKIWPGLTTADAIKEESNAEAEAA